MKSLINIVKKIQKIDQNLRISIKIFMKIDLMHENKSLKINRKLTIKIGQKWGNQIKNLHKKNIETFMKIDLELKKKTVESHRKLTINVTKNLIKIGKKCRKLIKIRIKKCWRISENWNKIRNYVENALTIDHKWVIIIEILSKIRKKKCRVHKNWLQIWKKSRKKVENYVKSDKRPF